VAESQERLAAIDIRVLTERAEYERTCELQAAVWGFSERDQAPPRLFIVIRKVGGLSMGAFDGETMIGFSMAMPGKRPDGTPFLHSNMTGLLPEYQNIGLGRRMKLAQREEALKPGYRFIEWTFDPLEIRNAYFNIAKLGAVVRRYEPNCYGITSSRLHGSIPTDRLVGEWELDSPRVEAAAATGAAPMPPAEMEIPVPGEASRVRASNPARAVELQTELRERFLAAFADGLVVTGYRREGENGIFQLSRES
jgi:predicted GNAT superfamily acetyltransferase